MFNCNGKKQVIRTKRKNLFFCVVRGASRREWSEGVGRKKREDTSAPDYYCDQQAWRTFCLILQGGKGHSEIGGTTDSLNETFDVKLPGCDYEMNEGVI